MNIDHILHNLKIVGMLGEQDKLVTSPHFGLRSPTTFRSILRRWYGENREADLVNLRNLMSSAICIAQLHNTRDVDGSNASNIYALRNDRLIESLCAALTGMQTLLRTYHDDQETCAKIELLIQECRDRINVIRPGIFANDSGVRESVSPSSCGTPRHTPSIGTAPSANPPLTCQLEDPEARSDSQ